MSYTKKYWINHTNSSKPLSPQEIFTGPAGTEDEQFQGMYIGEICAKMFNEDFDADKLQDWFSSGLNPNMKDNRNRTLLMLLLIDKRGKHSVELRILVKAFLETNQVKLNTRDDYNRTVFYYATGNNRVIRMLNAYKHKKSK